MDRSDVVADLTLSVTKACLVWQDRHDPEEPPPASYVSTVIRRRSVSLIRTFKTHWKTSKEVSSDPSIQRYAPTPEVVKLAEERDQVVQSLVQVLQDQMTPALFALLHLRFCTEMSSQEILRLTGDDDGKAERAQLSRDLYRAKVEAREILRGLAIEGYEDTRPGGVDD